MKMIRFDIPEGRTVVDEEGRKVAALLFPYDGKNLDPNFETILAEQSQPPLGTMPTA